MPRVFAVALQIVVAPAALGAQSTRSSELLAAARAQLPAHPDSAARLLDAAIAVAPYAADSAMVLVWDGIAHFYAGSDSLARASFRAAFACYPGLTVHN